MPALIKEATPAVEAFAPGARVVAFGHLGDGNIHFNFTVPKGGDNEAFLARWSEVTHAMHDLVNEFGGSISAEHGIGRLKAAEFARRHDRDRDRRNTVFKMAVDVLHYDDGVVDHESDGQHKRQQREQVDGIAERQKNNERAD